MAASDFLPNLIVCISELQYVLHGLIANLLSKVIVDILLNFFSKSSSLLRAMATRVFASLAAHISASALGRLLEVSAASVHTFVTRGLFEASHSLFLPASH